VNELIAGFTRQKTVQELVDLFTQYEVPHAPILGVRMRLRSLSLWIEKWWSRRIIRCWGKPL
jgi:hypothetical protein